jgi:hypothetical protein
MAYSESDMVYNRACSLSPAQKERLVRSMRAISQIGGVVVIGMLSLGLFFLSVSDEVMPVGEHVGSPPQNPGSRTTCDSLSLQTQEGIHENFTPSA